MGLTQRWRSWPSWVRDGLGAALLAVAALLPAFQPYGVELGELTWRPPNTAHIVLILLQTLPLTLRRRMPMLVLAGVGVAFAADQCLAFPASPGGLGLLFALYSAGAYQRRRRGLTVALGVAAYAALAVLLTLLGSPERAWGFATFGLVLAAAWVVGDLVRLRGVAARANAEDAAHAAVTDERGRLAGELHDVVSHHVTGMVVQADAAAVLLPPDETAVHEQLASIAAMGREALTDLRQLLDVLGSDGSPTRPAIGTIDDLVRQARAMGQPVELRETGTPRGGDEVRLAVFRIAQEGLTNARKHAPGAMTRLEAEWGALEVRVRLVSAPARSGLIGRGIPGSGRGLLGLAERVRRVGGRFESGQDAAGRFVIAAEIPLAEQKEPGDE